MEQMRKGEAAVDLKIASQQEKKGIKPPVLVTEPVRKTTTAEKVSIFLLVKKFSVVALSCNFLNFNFLLSVAHVRFFWKKNNSGC